MIVMVRGILDSVTEDLALVEVNGITYGVLISRDLMDRLSAGGKVGQEVTLHTMQYIEGNIGMGNLMPRLVGFLSKTDLEFFTLLITVQGLGVKKALRALTIPVKDVAKAIELNDVGTLKRLPEIGSKTAQKIVMELKGKAAKFAFLSEEEIPEPFPAPDMDEEYMVEAYEILLQLQYSELEARDLVRRTVKAFPEFETAEELIQEIFKRNKR
ncbi:MAG: Holliday junction branch migration protein RuvA [Candidatus Latescibacter sp.]|nr:Holliday junction branch migration protein RuvA [Candidatus Latescibacter sp.]